jgi:hypothetical protein
MGCSLAMMTCKMNPNLSNMKPNSPYPRTHPLKSFNRLNVNIVYRVLRPLHLHNHNKIMISLYIYVTVKVILVMCIMNA